LGLTITQAWTNVTSFGARIAQDLRRMRECRWRWILRRSAQISMRILRIWHGITCYAASAYHVREIRVESAWCSVRAPDAHPCAYLTRKMRAPKLVIFCHKMTVNNKTNVVVKFTNVMQHVKSGSEDTVPARIKLALFFYLTFNIITGISCLWDETTVTFVFRAYFGIAF
jgi:hypothetical protein